jgi:cytochrome oxidase Cu insertion factor (SCO1/SenC/PrrC family)
MLGPTARRVASVAALGIVLGLPATWAFWSRLSPSVREGSGLPASGEVDAEQLRRARLMEELMAGKVEGGGFTLVDQNRATRGLTDFRGRLVVLYFGYTSCPGVCSADLWQIGEMVRGLGADGAKVQPLFITIDPERDTPERLRAYLADFDPLIVGLTGTINEIRRVADHYSAYFAKVPLEGSAQYMMDHSAYIYLLNRDGAFVGALPSGTKADRLAEALGAYLQ